MKSNRFSTIISELNRKDNTYKILKRNNIFASSEMEMNYIYTNENNSLINEENNTTIELLLSKIIDPYNCKIGQIIILVKGSADTNNSNCMLLNYIGIIETNYINANYIEIQTNYIEIQNNHVAIEMHHINIKQIEIIKQCIDIFIKNISGPNQLYEQKSNGKISKRKLFWKY